MRRLAFVAAFSMLALFGLTPAAFAQDEDTPQEDVEEELVEELLEVEPAEPVEPLEEERQEAQ